MAKDGGGECGSPEPESAGLTLRSMCMALATIRRRLAGGAPPELHVLEDVAASLSACATAGVRDPAAAAAVMALLDETAGLVGQLELERDALRLRIRAWNQHGRAQSSYSAGKAPR